MNNLFASAHLQSKRAASSQRSDCAMARAASRVALPAFRLAATPPVRSHLRRKSRHAGQFAPFHPLEERAACSRDEGEVIGDPRLIERCDRVAAAGH